MTERVGTLYYIAPEVLEQSYDCRCDLWSCGVTLYQILCGYPAFNDPDADKTLKAIKEGNFTFDGDEWEEVSDEAKDLIVKFLQVNPDDRITIADALEHPWIINYSLSDIVSKEMVINTFDMLKNFHAP